MNERLLALFAEHPDGFLSGERISRDLGVSRTAVWKHIQALKAEGYDFESSPRKGYRLVGRPERIRAAVLQARLTTRRLGRALRLVDETPSTQDEAHAWVAQGASHGALVVAEAQTAGRGRLGRSWHSPKSKGVWMSLVLKPDIPLPLTPQLTLLAAVALCRTLRRLTGKEAAIKWPNDILIGDRKVSGILMESSAEDERLNYVVAGVGVSVNLRREDFPPELQTVATSLLLEAGRPIEREELIALFLEQLEELYELYRREGFSPIRTLWEALSSTLGRTVSIKTPQGVEKGIALRLDETGALVVRREEGGETKVFSGDVRQETGTFQKKTM
jgi:BirA family biotin operon repressor/biotin-[acetyl-CoA-carboxylase] ligase